MFEAGDRLGTLEVGKAADVCVFDADRVAPANRGDVEVRARRQNLRWLVERMGRESPALPRRGSPPERAYHRPTLDRLLRPSFGAAAQLRTTP